MISSTQRRLSAWAILAAAGLVLGACQPDVLPPSGPHPTLTSDKVTIYQNKPFGKKYELLGTVQLAITPEMKWDDKGDSTAGFDALKSKAGAMVANGLLLMADKKLYDRQVGVGYAGTYYLVPMLKEPKTAFAEAIYVLPEK